MPSLQTILNQELISCIQEVIAVVAEMIATEKPLSDKLYNCAKKAKAIEKKKERINIRSIEI